MPGSNHSVAMLLLATVFVSCSEQRPVDEYVARVGQATLTQKNVEENAGGQPEHLVRQYVSNWVMSEILFQEAQRRGFATSEAVMRQAGEAKRQFAITAYLEQEVYSDEPSAIRDSDLQHEFTSNAESYRLPNDVVKMSFAVFDERDEANAFRSKVLRGARWEDAVQSVRSDEGQSRHLLRVATGEYFTQAVLYPEELWKIARALSKEDISYVVRTNAGYCVAVVHDVKRQGELPQFDYVKEEIRQRLAMKRRNEKYAKLLDQLRAKYEVDVRLAAGDTTRGNVNEE
ncbi:MAG: peptidyl-prolyl cis-trans isomerase [Bacteroidetes bacterium]|nr:peptidyl-prolyl cis-trans isomerase [Bacteroidota bacterium]MCW5894721.1 peptidyl-prolyl cis-trans isomerase [Bacteroidota bacterium]